MVEIHRALMLIILLIYNEVYLNKRCIIGTFYINYIITNELH
jgi:hypothetical protein